MSTYLDQRNSIMSDSVSRQNVISGHSPAMHFSPRPAGEIKLYLDMDGVLTDFTGACEKLGKHMTFWFSNDKERFGKHLIYTGAEFWSEMPWIAGGKELYGFLERSGFSPTILSAVPSQERGKAIVDARKGKIQWLRKELGIQYARDAILCFRHEKALQSGISRVLIDDSSENIHEWEGAGGIGILHKNASRTIRCFSQVLEDKASVSKTP
jgi:hypothetical protein